MSPAYPLSPGFKDRGSSTTSAEAAAGVAPKASTIRERVLQALEQAGPRTAEQLGEQLDLHWMLVRARLSELRAQGLVADSGQRGAGALGGRVIVWRATTEHERVCWRTQKADAERRGEPWPPK